MTILPDILQNTSGQKTGITFRFIGQAQMLLLMLRIASILFKMSYLLTGVVLQNQFLLLGKLHIKIEK